MSPIEAISHIAVGVTEMERSLRFYRDVLGMHVSLDTEEQLPGCGGSDAQNRRAVYLRWREGAHETFVVLDNSCPARLSGNPRRCSRWALTTGVSGSATSTQS